MPAQHSPDILSRYREAVDAALRQALGEDSLPMFDMLRYHMGWLDERFEPAAANTGKAVRPALCLFACEAVSETWQQALPAAAALELVHNFSLIHDDIQDGDTERRHRPTVWYLWGYSHGLNSGTALNVVANQAMRRLGAGLMTPPNMLEANRVLTGACMEMIEGQTLDMSFENRLKVSTGDYLSMIEKKTGALLEASVHLGAALGSANATQIEGMRAFGHAVGRLFQVRDDMLGVWGKAEDTGKPIASDLRRRKKSLPVVHALQSGGQSEAGKRFAAIYRTKDTLAEEDIEALLGAMAELGTQDYCQTIAEDEARKALAALQKTPLSTWGKAEGAELVTFLLEREF